MVSSNLFLQFSSLIINVKAYFITCFSPKVMQKNVKNPTKDSEWVLRDSKCSTKALKVQVCYINCFINKKTEQKRYLMTTIGNKKKEKKCTLSFSPSYFQFNLFIPFEKIYEAFWCFKNVQKYDTENKWVTKIYFVGLGQNRYVNKPMRLSYCPEKYTFFF